MVPHMNTEGSLPRDQAAAGGQDSGGRDVLFAWIAVTLLFVLTSLPAPPAGGQLLPVGSEFRIDTYPAESQRFPAVAADPDGDFVVVWSDRNFTQPSPDGDLFGVFGQRVARAGTPIGTEFQINSYTTGNQRFPTVAAGVDGDFLVVWEGRGATGDGIFGQRYDSASVPLGTEFQVSAGGVNAPVLSASPQGGSLVAWWGGSDGGPFGGIFGQRYDRGGTQQGTAFQANSYTTGTQRNPAVAAQADGGFVVVWESYKQDLSSYGVFGQRFDSAGAPRGTEFQVNTETAFDQRAPAVASDPEGRTVVLWSSIGQDGDGRGIFGQEFDATGARVNQEFQVNSYTTGDQDTPAVAVSARGTLLVVWDASQNGVFGQRYESQSCAGDCSGDRIVSVDELVSGVNIALGNSPVGVCPAFDSNRSDTVSINELLGAVNAALNGCD